MSATRLHRVGNDTEAAQALATILAQSAARHRGRFNIAVSGGSLPKTFASALKVLEGNPLIDPPGPTWHIYFVDERHVPPTSEDSNLKGFLDAVAGIAAFTMHPVDTSLPLVESAAAYEKEFTGEGGQIIHCCLLGLGPDGHTASLFPGRDFSSLPSSSSPHALVSYVTDSPKPPPQRVTLTLKGISAAEKIAVVALGASKAEAITKCLTDTTGTFPTKLIESVAPVEWIVDKSVPGGPES